MRKCSICQCVVGDKKLMADPKSPSGNPICRDKAKCGVQRKMRQADVDRDRQREEILNEDAVFKYYRGRRVQYYRGRRVQ